MKKLLFVFLAAVLTLGLATVALAHTGGEGVPEEHDVNFTSLDTVSVVENELVNNPTDARKGWWFATLRNNTTSAWASVTINAGAGDLVAIVQGNGLADEWGFTANSVQVNKAGTIQYIGPLGTGSRLYDNGVTGQLWSQVEYSFTTPVAIGQSVAFRVYTDNSWYEGPYADSYSLRITPDAVPEPGSMLALGSGMIGMAGFAWRRRR